MATRKFKARRKSSIKKAASVVNDRRRPQPPQWPWSELPPFLQRNNLRWSYNLNTRAGAPPGITKSWLPSTTTRCAAAAAAHQRPQLYHIIADSSPNPINPNHPLNDHFVGDSSSIAEAVCDMPDASHWCYLKSDQTARNIHPPPGTPFRLYNSLGLPLHMFGVLGPNAPTSGLIVRYTVNRSRFWSTVSIRHECRTADPFDAKKKVLEFTCSLVRCGDKFYATSLQGALVVMEANDARLKITGVGAIRAVPSVRCRFFKEYLVEMKGEILLVFLIHERCVGVVDGVEVFRLDLGKLDWIKVERLGGNTLFLKKSCIWVDSEEVGCRDDRVYFTSGSGSGSGSDQDSWWVYDMKSGCISSANYILDPYI